MGEIYDAALALDKRKLAAGVNDGPRPALEHFKLLLSGFDLDAKEIEEFVGRSIVHAEQQLKVNAQAGLPLGPALASLWVDGIGHGLLIAEHRNREREAAKK